MSRIGKQAIAIPEGVSVDVKDGLVTVKGKLGSLERKMRPEVKLSVGDAKLEFTVENPEHSKYWGLERSLINNMVIGVTQGYKRSLELVGTGYRITQKGNYLVFFVGHSHDIWFELPEGITAEIKVNKLTLSGIDKQKVNQAAAVIRGFRKPEPYKGKGIKYSDEIIRRKAGKTAG